MFLHSFVRYGLTVAFCLTLAFGLQGCKLQYAGEEFTLKINQDGSGFLAVTYQDFGSGETETDARNNDLEILKQTAKDKKIVSDARKKGVDLQTRRLDFDNYMVNAYVEASAKSVEDLFDVFTAYEFQRESNSFYLFPKAAAVTQAVLSDGGKIVKRKGQVAFRWPNTATEISFKATYIVEGSSFRYDFQKRYENGG